VPGAFAAFSALDDGRHRAELYRMWATQHAAGFTHPKSLETMGPRASPNTERARLWLLDGTTRGRPVTELVRSGGARFEEFERALLTLGEESGRFDDALRLLGDFYMKKHQLMLWVKKKMAYPLFTGLAACFIAPLPLVFMGRTVAYFVFAFGAAVLLLAASGGLVAAVAARYGRKPPMARARMARALSTAIEAGLTLPRALRLAADASASPEIRAFVQKSSEKQLSARSISASLAGCPHLTPEFLSTLDISERTGDFAPLARLADMYEDGFR
jgi:type II secretory pathway component PulF